MVWIFENSIYLKTNCENKYISIEFIIFILLGIPKIFLFATDRSVVIKGEKERCCCGDDGLEGGGRTDLLTRGGGTLIF